MKIKAFRVGLIGKVASGKSSAAKSFSALGVPVIDLEPFARPVSEAEQPPLELLVERFGPSILTPWGHLNPPVLRQIVFSQPKARIELEALTQACLSAQVMANSAKAGGPYQVLVIPLLLEKSLGAHLNRVLMVDCEEDLQIRRSGPRDSTALDQAHTIVSAGASHSSRPQEEFDVIMNNGDVNAVRDQVNTLHTRYLALARRLHGAQNNDEFT